jgi:hypothetical protein
LPADRTPARTSPHTLRHRFATPCWIRCRLAGYSGTARPSAAFDDAKYACQYGSHAGSL